VARLLTASATRQTLQRKIAVAPGVNLDTMGYNVTKTGNVYSAPSVVKGSIWNEIVTGLLANDFEFKLAGTTDKDANASFRKHILARQGVVEFARNAKFAFGAGASSTANPDFWNRVPTGIGWQVKPGKDEVEASKDLLKNPKAYAVACEMAAHAALIGGGGGGEETRGLNASRDDWIPGDVGYIRSKDPKPSPVYAGENIISLGQDQFWGHMTAKTFNTLPGWVAVVKSWSGIAPEIDEPVGFPDPGLDTSVSATPGLKVDTK
jgi:hypothetical protein